MGGAVEQACSGKCHHSLALKGERALWNGAQAGLPRGKDDTSCFVPCWL